MMTLVFFPRERGVQLPVSAQRAVALILAFVASIGFCGCSGTLASNLSGISAGQLIASTSSVSFGSVAIGQTASLNVTLVNQGKSSVQISQVSVSGQSFSANSQSSIPTTIGANGSLNVTIQFNPTSTGTASGQLTVMSNAAPATPTAVNLNGTGVPSPTGPILSVNATTLAFGDVGLNTPATQSVTLSSTGSSAVTVSAATISGSGFTVSGASLPVTLNPNQTVTLSVQFTPTAASAVTGSLTIASNSTTGATNVINLSGTGASGAASGSGQVTLTWDAPSTSPDPVAGYNVFRSPSGASSYQQLNSSAVTGTSYTDSTAQAGQSYNYVVLSVDASGVESGPSNVASAAL